MVTLARSSAYRPAVRSPERARISSGRCRVCDSRQSLGRGLLRHHGARSHLGRLNHDLPHRLPPPRLPSLPSRSLPCLAPRFGLATPTSLLPSATAAHEVFRPTLLPFGTQPAQRNKL